MATESESGDAISSLPDETVAQILSYLPTKQAASSTTLSKRWRTPFTLMIGLFSSQHHLDFDQSYFLNPKQSKRQRKRRRDGIEQSFRAFVDHNTLSCNKHINKFSLKYREDLCYAAQTNQWINNALERAVSELDLCIKTTRLPRPLPSGLFTSKTLVKLSLGKELCIGTEPPKVFLPLLKSLSLDTVYTFDEDWDFHRGDFWSVMLQGCPLLEELFLNYLYSDPNEHPRQPNIISHKTLKRLTTRRRKQRIVFETPSLVYLDYSDYYTMGIESADFLDSLIEARLDLDAPEKRPFRMDNTTSIIIYMKNVDILHLSSNTVKVLCRLHGYWEYGWGRSFLLLEKLLKLSFETDMERGWELLTIMIDNAPKLETIVLKGLHCISYTGVCVNANVVKVLEIYGYRGSGRQLKRFLSQMDRLRVIKVEIDAAIDGDDKKRQITNDLLSLPKCQIQFL